MGKIVLYRISKWLIYASVTLAIIVSDNGLLPGRHQAIIWTNAEILLIGPLGGNFSDIFNRNIYIFIQESALENVVWDIAVILSRPQCVNSRTGFVVELNDWRNTSV